MTATLAKPHELQYYLHDEWDAFRIEVAGSLSGEGVQSIHQAWHTALSIMGGRPLIIDLTYLLGADERGRALIRAWHQNGARILASSAQARALVEPVIGEPLEAPPVKQSWLQRLAHWPSSHSRTAA